MKVDALLANGVPIISAPFSPDYPQFTQVVVPVDSGAESAWMGEIKPFLSDQSARAFLHQIERGRQIWLTGGRIQEAVPEGTHWADPLLVKMDVICRLLILVYPSPAHPRAYLLKPTFHDYYAVVHPHPRYDQRIIWQNKEVPGLCVYSAAEFTFDPNKDRNAQFMDQVTLYVARHLIWLRTRQLFRGTPPDGVLIRSLLPGETLITDRPISLPSVFLGLPPTLAYWRGYWPGPTARAFNPATHYRSIKPKQECWCGSGNQYKDCHRDSDCKRSGAIF